jgi:hypothetical protein
MATTPIDIVMLTHNRLDHLVQAVDALEERTPEPYRLTVVDNASGPEVRNWLAANRRRFAHLILRDANEHVAAFAHGIAVTSSDPFVVTDPDVVVPDLEPSWLAQMLDLLARHPDFGLIGLGCDPSNRPPPPVLEPEVIDPRTLVDGEIVETGVGTIFQFIRRDALVTPYRSDAHACTAVKRAGYRAGWSPNIRGLHLGWDDFRRHPGHLLGKRNSNARCYPESYAEIDLLQRPATLEELALAAPVLAEIRRHGIPDAAVLELAFDGPALGAAATACVSVESDGAGRIPLADGSAGAVVLNRPPAASDETLLEDACRVARRLVIAVAPLETFPGRTAADLAPAGWNGREASAVGDLQLTLLREPADPRQVEQSVADHRERWIEMLAGATFGESALRLWIWERADTTASTPAQVLYDPARIRRWRPGTLLRPPVSRRGPLRRFWARADVLDRSEVWRARTLRWFQRRVRGAPITRPGPARPETPRARRRASRTRGRRRSSR